MFDKDYFECRSYGKQGEEIIQRNYRILIEKARKVFPEVFSNNLANYTILDFGCAYGAGTFFLSKVFPNATIVGVDISRYAIEKAIGRYSSKNITYLCLDLSRPRDVEYLKGRIHNKFDIIFTRDTLEHIPKRAHEYYIRTFASLLKENGIVIAQTPNNLNIYAHLCDKTHIGLGSPRYWRNLFKRYFKEVKVSTMQYIPIIWRVRKNRGLVEIPCPLFGFNVYIFCRRIIKR